MKPIPLDDLFVVLFIVVLIFSGTQVPPQLAAWPLLVACVPWPCPASAYRRAA